jgi:hypothetical protein
MFTVVARADRGLPWTAVTIDSGDNANAQTALDRVGALGDIDDWLRRKLRCVRLKQCKRVKATADFLVKCGQSRLDLPPRRPDPGGPC